MAEILNHLRSIKARITGHGRWKAEDFVPRERYVSEIENDPFFKLAKRADWRETTLFKRDTWEIPLFYLKMERQATPCSSEDPKPKQK